MRRTSLGFVSFGRLSNRARVSGALCPPSLQVLALVGQRVGRRLAHLNALERLVDADSVVDRQHARGDRGRALPTGSAMEVRPPPLPEPVHHLLDRALDQRGWEAAVVRERETLLLDARLGEGSLDLLALTRAVLAVLREVQHPLDAEPVEHGDILAVERVRADQQPLEHVGVSVGPKPGRHEGNDGWSADPTGATPSLSSITVPMRTDTFDLAGLQLPTGGGRRLELHVALDGLELGGERYELAPALAPVELDVSRTVGSGYALRLRFEAALEGPCMRCLEPAAPVMAVDSLEVSQPSEELDSPYLDGEVLDLGGWAHDALALSLPAKLLCREDCAGLCPVCGADLNQAGPEHRHASEPDPRWAKLSELRIE